MKYILTPYVSTIILYIFYNLLYCFVDARIQSESDLKPDHTFGLLFVFFRILPYLGVLTALTNAGLLFVAAKQCTIQMLFNHLFGIILDFSSAIVFILDYAELFKCYKNFIKGKQLKMPRQPLMLLSLQNLLN